MSDSEDPLDLIDEGGDDLFGDDDDEPKNNVLSDDDLASEPARRSPSDRGGEEDNEDVDMEDDGYVRHKEKVIMGIEVYRHRTPRSKDGSIQSLRVPNFLKFIPEQYDPKTFEPSKWDIENARDEQAKQSIRFYTDPDTGELLSNALMYRWSDGSLTMSVGDQHYAIQKKSTAPAPDKPYQELQDGHSYAAAAHLSSSLFAVVGHVSEEYTVRANKSLGDEALQRLAMRMREATSSSREGNRIIKTTHDPEMQKRQAEQAEKERQKAQRRREVAAARMDGIGRSGRGGLSIDDLEGGRRAPGAGRKRGAPGSGKPKRRRPEYDSDDDIPQGSRRQDDYDKEDNFIAPSDEELETEEESEGEELLDDDDEEEDEAPRHKKRKETKNADEDVDEDDVDADADTDDDAPAASGDHGRGRRRNVIDDDDE